MKVLKSLSLPGTMPGFFWNGRFQAGSRLNRCIYRFSAIFTSFGRFSDQLSRLSNQKEEKLTRSLDTFHTG